MIGWKNTFFLLILIISNINGQENTCYRRRCDQLITGRQLEYRRALQIIQSEQYLTAADLDLVRISRVKREAFHRIFYHYHNATHFNHFDPEVSLFPLAVMTGVVTLGSLAYLLTPEGPPVLLPPPGVAPAGEPQPGEFGGGSSPVANSVVAAEALSLAPLGTAPVAIFPNFASPRSVRAVGVIFSEPAPRFDKNTYYHTDHSYTKYRQNGRRRRRCRKGFSGLGTFLSILFRKRRVLRRKFGFVIKVRVADERCQLDVTCDIDGQRLDNSDRYDYGERRQTGEEFSSTAPPDCRTFFVGCNQ